ncbi:hypothetical protein PYCCODRAFT_1469938 [Trametes coccinea BRFM310]|uniref:Fungal-type protein kinase domain-containing protein n=1 Tax=Trametes coccinea (strain BRFM310) TaxID=1353009 RepID=A0A1Y2IFD9_TRAC3|nr:hypothetical protein PYCCODRAFT_1469938 [Trametes coccinea BRFM310]
MLSRAPVVPCAIGLLMQDEVAHIWLYNRDGAIPSTGLTILTDLPRFLVLLFALQRFQVQDFGFVEPYDLGAVAALQDTGPRESHKSVKQGKFYINPADVVYRTLSLKGRGTHVVEASDMRPPEGRRPEPVAKFSWVDCSRSPEKDLVDFAIQRAKERTADAEAVTVHMPYIAHSWDDSRWITDRIRQSLKLPLKYRRLRDPESGEVYRILRITLVERLQRLITLPDEHFIRGWFQLLIAHYHNWRNGIQHRDISLGNLMCRGGDKDPVCAVLNDWDLGVDAEDPNTKHTGYEVTGTVPFMAVDLLTHKGLHGNVAILYRHDLEAFIWVLIWAVCCYRDGKMVYLSPQGIHKWDVHDPISCGALKRNFLTNDQPIVPASDGWVYGAKLATELVFYLDYKDTERAVKRKAARQRWRTSDDTSTLLPQPTRVQEEDDPEHEWSDFWTWISGLQKQVPCIAEFIPKDLPKSKADENKQ